MEKKGCNKVDPGFSICEKWLNVCIRDIARKIPIKEEKKRDFGKDTWMKFKRV